MKNRLAILLLAALCAQALPAPAAESLHPLEPETATRLLPERGPAVVMLWSLDCPYCDDNLALLSRWQKKHPGLVVIRIATDSIDAASAIRARLRHYPVTGPCWVFGAAAPERIRHAIDPTWHGELPRSYLIGHDGHRQAISGRITATQLEALQPATTSVATPGT
ncbi:MAG: hypothetical protein JSR19_07755 [Proteobacteria bacterium]|nr:hypothetical protein [Pseudomonadota bacterium]HQR04886.1 hypothetical protein [Rhodocyclaceae bacterium]